MTLDEAEEVYNSIRSSQRNELVDEMVKCAVRYAEIRVAWALATIDVRMDIDATRTKAHNAFIDACNILSRNMHAIGEDNSWGSVIGNDRTILPASCTASSAFNLVEYNYGTIHNRKDFGCVLLDLFTPQFDQPDSITKQSGLSFNH